MADSRLKPLREGTAKQVPIKEMIIYLVSVFFYTNMTGMFGDFRRAYFVDGLMITDKQFSDYNLITSIFGYVMGFVYASIIDNKKIRGGSKFKHLGLIFAVPCGIITVLSFYTPDALQQKPSVLLAYLIIINLLQAGAFYFGGVINMTAVVMSPDLREREQVISFRGISSAVGNSAPMVIVLVIAAIVKAANGGTENLMLHLLLSSILCAVIGTVTMLMGFSAVKERIPYSTEKKKFSDFFEGFWDIVKNKHARVVVLSEFVKNFRGIATFMQSFIAAAMLGSTSKVMLFALPIGIGTMVGMLIINKLLVRFSSKTLYIASGVYSVLINCVAFGVGYVKITGNAANILLDIVFIVCLFLTGLQFGASNLLPDMFKADILDDLELKTGKRLDAGLPFVMGLGSGLSGIIAGKISPNILYGEGSIINYQQGLEDGTMQSQETKLLLLFFYTVVHGIMMLLAGLPFLFYKLSGKERERVHAELQAKRAAQEPSEEQAQEKREAAV